jgi:peptide deformylase
VTIRPILLWPDKRLRSPAAPVATITDEIRAIWTDMVDTMDAMPGVGLAGPQIGLMLRLAVVDVTNNRSRRILLANPQITAVSEEMRAHEEGSPCLPGVSARLERPRVVRVRFLNSDGVNMERDFSDLESTSVQHQIDHLEGRMYFDRLGRIKRDILLRRSRKVRA